MFMSNCQIREGKLFYNNIFLLDLINDYHVLLYEILDRYPANMQAEIRSHAVTFWHQRPQFVWVDEGPIEWDGRVE